MSHHNSLHTIINSINPDDTIFKFFFDILISFLFQYDDDEHRLDVSKKILKYFLDLEREGMNGWEVIHSFIKNTKKITWCFISSFRAFLNGLLLVISKNASLFMGWLQDMENIGIIDIIKSKFDNYFDQILEFIEEQRKMHVHGISMKIISSLSIDNKSENQRGQLEEIMNQLQNDNFLASEDPFFDLEKLEIQRKLGNGQFERNV